MYMHTVLLQLQCSVTVDVLLTVLELAILSVYHVHLDPLQTVENVKLPAVVEHVTMNVLGSAVDQ